MTGVGRRLAQDRTGLIFFASPGHLLDGRPSLYWLAYTLYPRYTGTVHAYTLLTAHCA